MEQQEQKRCKKMTKVKSEEDEVRAAQEEDSEGDNEKQEQLSHT